MSGEQELGPPERTQPSLLDYARDRPPAEARWFRWLVLLGIGLGLGIILMILLRAAFP